MTYTLCPVCRKYISVNGDGSLRAHGPRNNRCVQLCECGGKNGWHRRGCSKLAYFGEPAVLQGEPDGA